ncbi:thymidylate synthase [Bacillus phage Eoghan]|uniref:Thymidylate synthase n=2 Tax=Andromedavirus TaxID=1623275 RepID=M1IE75_9CAUD|nr:thymidylate synthase [Bacillus phage Eoghan]YP_009592279.1 thymidylate synthase [Bacillus phage Taylor]AGE60810.1 thymidylate synthase [Bacillus phage Eoghan]AGE60964.1 thymidylate synthase [Bacillus phage Taylor]
MTEKYKRHIPVLDKGYVRYKDHMGSDLTVVNAARVSYHKESLELTEADARLIRFLAREGHTSPFRHASLQLEMYAPLMVARQHWKYVVGSDHTMDAWNEGSRRYVNDDVEFYLPLADEWRSAPENSKQGSGEPLPEEDGLALTEALYDHQIESLELYERALENGVCTEQARLFLPAYGLYVRYWWTGSLQSICHFLAQRLEEDSQVEIQEYAKAVLIIARELFPTAVEQFVKEEES